jgi:hypothetical protein
MKTYFESLFLWAINFIPPFFFLFISITLCNLTLIDMKFIFLIGAIGMIVLPLLLKDLAYTFAEWQEENFPNAIRGSLTTLSKEKTINQTHQVSLFFLVPALGFGLFLSTFLLLNLTLPTSNITESIQIPILKVRTTYRHRSREPNGKEATVQIKNYIKDINFHLESEIKEGQLLNFWVRKGYFGFDIFKKL